MADYKAIKGHTIQTVAGDPGTIVDGLIWYDSVARTIQGSKTAAGAWASGGNLNTARRTPGGTGNGTQTAFSIFGGTDPPSASYPTVHEQYDGSSWTEAADINTARYECKCGAGTQAAALYAGGVAAPGRIGNSEEWDNSSWAEGPDINTNAAASASAGTQTAALGIAGSNYPTLEDAVESYDGSSWTEIADINSGRYYVKGNGTQTAALISGGASFSPVPDGTHYDKTETWDGTSWTEGASLNVARAYDMAAFGTSTSAIHAGGDSGPGNRALSEEWDGSSWTEVGDLSTAIRYTVGGGTTSAGIQASGYTSNDSNVTQEWTQASAAVTFTSS